MSQVSIWVWGLRGWIEVKPALGVYWRMVEGGRCVVDVYFWI